MALRGTELILFVRAQNQASYTLRRIAGDVRALTHARDLHARAETLAIQQAKNAARQTRIASQLASRAPGGAGALALETRKANLALKQGQYSRAIERSNRGIYDVNTQILRNKERQLRIDDRIKKQRIIDPTLTKTVRGRQLSILNQANTRQLISQSARIGEYNDAIKVTQRRIKNLDLDINKLSADYKKNQAAIKGLIEEQRIAERQAKQLALAQRQVAQAMRLQGAERVATAGRAIAHTGRIAQLGGLVGTAALGAASAQAASFDTLVTQAATQARDIGAPLAQTAQRADQIRAHILAAMQTFPANAEEMAASAYDIFSSVNLVGSSADQLRGHFRLMDAANKVAVAGNEDLATATNALITVTNNFDPNLKNLNGNLNTMFAIIRFGRMRLGDFNDMMNKVAPAARGAGQTLNDVGGAMAYLTTQMPSQSQVATGIGRLLQILQHPDFVAGMDALHAPITMGEGANRRLKPLVDIITTLTKRFPELRKGGVEAENIIRTVTRAGRQARTGSPGEGIAGTIFAQRSLRLLSTGLDAYRRVQGDVVGDTKEFNKAYMAMINTQGIQWKIFINQVKVAVLLIGQAAIPVFIQFGKYLQNLVNWFRNLDPQTRNFYVRLAAVISILSLVGGIVASVVGGLVTMIATLRIMSLTSGAAGEGLTGLALWGARALSVLKLLGAIGVIAIILKVLWSGDASAKDFLMGALAGGALGFAIGGPLGAAIGAITVPVVLEVITKFRQDPKQMAGAREAFADQQRRATRGEAPIVEFKDFEQEFMRKAQAMHLPLNLMRDQLKSEWTAQAQAALKAGAITQVQYLKGMELVGFSGQAVANQRKQFNRNFINLVPKTLTFTQKLENALKGVRDGTIQDSEIAKWRKYFDQLMGGASGAAKSQRDLARASREARAAAQQDIQQAATKLTQTYNELLQANQQTFGQLFQGPWLQSEFGQTAEEWGVKAQIQDLTKDLKQQLNEFNRFNSGLAGIAARGAPAELVNELQKLGPDALDKIETLRKAAPGKFNEFISVWKDKQEAIKRATTLDFNKQLAQWFKYGKSIAQQIIFGLRSEDVALDNAFQRYITSKFPDYINQAVAKARAEEKKNQPAETKRPGVKPPKQPAGHTTTVHDNSVVTVQQAKDESAKDAARRAAHLFKTGARTRHGGESGR